MPVMLSIGEFSRVVGMTVKALRFYHEEGLLIPAVVDPRSGYRYYDAGQIDTARAIRFLRDWEFSVEEIRDLLKGGGGDDVLAAVERQRAAIAERLRRLRGVARALDEFIKTEKEARAMSEQVTDRVEEKVLPAMVVAGVRMRGKYAECGKGFAKVARAFGRHVSGTCFLLHYDAEYKEDGAEFEACFPIAKAKPVDGIDVRELPGGRCLSIVHKGPYDQLGRAYAKILAHARERGLEVALPTREVYLKGPGMIFKGNPKNYLTEIQMIVSSPAGAGSG